MTIKWLIEFVFSGPFIFIGALLLLVVIFDGIASIFAAIRGGNASYEPDEE